MAWFLQQKKTTNKYKYVSCPSCVQSFSTINFPTGVIQAIHWSSSPLTQFISSSIEHGLDLQVSLLYMSVLTGQRCYYCHCPAEPI